MIFRGGQRDVGIGAQPGRGRSQAQALRAIAARHRAPAAGACLLYSLSRWCRRSSLVPSLNAALGKRPEPERSTTASASLSLSFSFSLFLLPSSWTVARVGDRRTSQGTRGERIGATRQRSPLLLSARRFCSCCSFRSSSRMYPRSTYKPTYRALDLSPGKSPNVFKSMNIIYF